MQKYIAAELRQEALDFFAAAAEFVNAPAVHTACRDAKDNKFLDLADAAGASTLITGDKDLLALQGLEKSLGMKFSIMSGREWLDQHPLPQQEPITPGSGVKSIFTIRKPALA